VSTLEELVELSNILGYNDEAVENGNTYHYAVIAINLVGRSVPSDVVEATPVSPATVPGRVTDLVIKAKGTRAILTWSAPDDGGSPITGYIVLRGTSSDSLEEIDQVGLVTTYTDSGLERGTTYHYALRAVNDIGQGEPSSTQSVKVEEEDGGGLSLPLLIALAVIAVIVIAVLLMRPRGKQEEQLDELLDELEHMEDEEPVEPTEAEEEPPEEDKTYKDEYESLYGQDEHQQSHEEEEPEGHPEEEVPEEPD
jgi:hypothetical protein